MSTDPQAQKIFEKSFRHNLPKLCAGRQVIILDNAIARDPQDDKKVNSHAGPHFKTLKKFVEHAEFYRMNEPLAEIDDGPVLIIDNLRLQSRSTSFSCKQRMFV